MRAPLKILLTLTLIVPPLLADEKKGDKPNKEDKAAAGSRAEQLTAIKDKFKNALPEVRTGLSKAISQADKDSVIDKMVPIWAEAVQLADAADDAVSKEAMKWVMDSSNGAPVSPKLLALFQSLPATKTAKAHREIAGQAHLVLANTYLEQSETLNASDKTKAAELQAKAEKLFEQIAKDYADVPSRSGTLGKAAQKSLYNLRNLAIGKSAPDAEGSNLEGKKAKLSDYRGKVVVLDIWATWCGPCRAMIPHERELVKRLASQPFALISVSADDKKETLTKFLEKEPMPWTHWHNGSKGGILEAYNVQFFPTIFVLDAKGVIRYKNVRGKEMDEAVDKLLKELTASTSGSR